MILSPIGNLKPGVDYIVRLICVCISATQFIHIAYFSLLKLFKFVSHLLHRGNTKLLCKYTTLRLVSVESLLSEYIHLVISRVTHAQLHNTTQETQTNAV